MSDYVAGKLDWLAAGLPVQGAEANQPTAGSVARKVVATCSMRDTVRTARKRAAEAGIEVCVVVTDGSIVLGLLRAEELRAADDTRATDAMSPGPSTFRPHVPIAEMAQYLVDEDMPSAPITTSDGKLVGVLLREDAVALQDR